MSDTVAEKDELERIAEEVRKVIVDNRKFLARVMEEDFEPEPEPEPAPGSEDEDTSQEK